MIDEFPKSFNITPKMVIAKFNEIDDAEIRTLIFNNLEDLRNKRIEKQICKTLIKTIISPYIEAAFIFDLYLLLHHE